MTIKVGDWVSYKHPVLGWLEIEPVIAVSDDQRVVDVGKSYMLSTRRHVLEVREPSVYREVPCARRDAP